MSAHPLVRFFPSARGLSLAAVITLAASVFVPSTASAQQGCQVSVRPSQRGPDLVYVGTLRQATTLGLDEADREMRRFTGFDRPVERKNGLLFYDPLPDQPGLPRLYGTISVDDTQRNLMVHAHVPRSQPVHGVAEAMCRFVAKAEIPLSPRPKTPASRTAPPSAEEKGIEILAPGVPFYVDEARDALGEGNATIKGVACSKHYGVIKYRKDLPVFLYPASPYIDEMDELLERFREDGGKSRMHLLLLPDVFQQRLEGHTNEDGEFRFSRLKPGRYYLTARYDTSFTVKREVAIGSYTNGMGFRSDITQMQNFEHSFDETLRAFVEVKDGEEVSVALQPDGNWLRRLGGCD